MSADFKTATGCTFSKVGTAELAQPLLKGSAKVYTQGVYYFVSDSKDREGKFAESEVLTVVSAESSASNLLTVLGAVAVGVAALTF